MILVVDDHADSADLLARLLRGVGLQGEAVSSGTAALAILEMLLPEAVILDHQMPVMTGLEVLRKMRESRRCEAIPVIIYSANCDPRDFEEAQRLGAAEWLIKCKDDWGDVLSSITRVLKESIPQESAPRMDR